MAGLKTIYTELALYNRWQNGVVYARCEALEPAALEARRECLFFGTLRATLDHIAHVDRVLLGFITTGQPVTDFRPGELQFASFAELAARRPALDDEILALVRDHPEAWLEAPIEYYSERLQRRRCFPRAFLFTQLFNHQTHHRAQATAALHGLGVDYGATDLPVNPLSQF